MCGNVCRRLFHPVLICVQAPCLCQTGNKLSIEAPVASDCDPGCSLREVEVREVEWCDPHCIITFSIYYSTALVTWDGIALAVSESRKTAQNQPDRSLLFLLLVTNAACRRGRHDFDAWLKFPHVNQAFLTSTRLFIVEPVPLLHHPNTLQCHRCLEWCRLRNSSFLVT